MTHRHTTTVFRRGTAMLEFIMVIPLLAIVIAGTFFFGQLMRNQQRLRVADRYEAWQPAGQSNPLLFDGRGENVSIRTGTGPTETLEDLHAQAAGESPEASRLADWLLLTGSQGRFPRGWSRRVDADFPRETAAIERIRNAVTEDRGEHVEPAFGPSRYRQHAREGLAWKRRHEDGFCEGSCPCNPGQAVRHLYFDELDEQTERIAGTAIGGALRSLYLNGW